MKHLLSLSLLVCIMIFPACKSAQVTTTQVVQPPQITLPSHIKTIAIVDRTLIDKKNKIKNTIEGWSSGERAGQDRLAEQEVLAGLNTVLQTSPTIKVKLTTVQLVGSGRGFVFPDPLDSAQVIKICNQYSADALAVLETFDSDCAGRTGIIKMGFRIYDRQNNSIADQYFYTYRTKWKRSHSMNQSAMKTRFSESAAINQAAYDAGVNYGRRIAATVNTVVQKPGRK
ncbi:MAG: DUF6340 family protein [Cytophagaceae bacterium]